MSQTDLYPSQAPSTPAGSLDLDDLEHRVLKSKVVAWGLIAGLPTLGIAASLTAGVPLFAALMAGCFLLATALVCRKALATFTGKALRLLVSARMVFLLVLGGLLFCTGGAAWVALVGAALLWLCADRLLGRRALFDLWRRTRARK